MGVLPAAPHCPSHSNGLPPPSLRGGVPGPVPGKMLPGCCAWPQYESRDAIPISPRLSFWGAHTGPLWVFWLDGPACTGQKPVSTSYTTSRSLCTAMWPTTSCTFGGCRMFHSLLGLLDAPLGKLAAGVPPEWRCGKGGASTDPQQ